MRNFSRIVFKSSIRWRLTLTYAGIAVLATVCLGAALLLTLRGYYAERERLHLQNNALAISESVRQLQAADKTPDEMRVQLLNLSFITQARVRVMNTNGETLVDTGTPPNELTLGYTQMLISGGGAEAAPTFNVAAMSSDFSAPFIRLSGGGISGDATVVPVTAGVDGVSIGGDIRGSGERLQSVDVNARLFNIDTTARGQTWVQAFRGTSGTYVDPGFDTLPLPESTSPNADIVFMAVASTPYGFDLIGEVKPGVRSDQVVRVPITNADGVATGYVELSEGITFGAQIVENVAIALVFAGGGAIVIAGLVGWFVSRRISQPVLSLTAGAERMAQGDLSARVHVPGHDEFSVMARTFNDMAAQVEATILALRRFVADAAHELHTPLTALRADLELAATDGDPSRRADFVLRARSQVHRLELLTDNLLDLSRIEGKTRKTAPRSVDLAQVVRELSEAYASRAEQVNVQFCVDVPDTPIRTMGDELQLRRAIGNLLDNAIKFTPDGGVVGIALRRAGGCVEVSVNDTGIGIPADDLPQLFSRFHRGRNANIFPGSGLGLAIIKAVLDGHDGRISVRSVPGDTRFTVQLPAA